MPSGGHFVPCRTTRLMPGIDSDIDVLKIAKALETTKEEIVGIQARFGGKAYDITWTAEEIAEAAACTGLDHDGQHYELRLLGRKSLDVSIFVTCEFPDEYLVELLRPYGDFNERSIRRLKLKERGYEHIENGVRVVTFTSMDRHLPNAIVYRNTPLGFRYTGQVKLCFKCASPDHTIRDCPTKKRNAAPQQEPEQEPEHEQEQETQPTEQKQETDNESNQQETDNESNYATDKHETSDGESDMETQNATENKTKRPKRHRTESPIHSDTDQPAPKKQTDEQQQTTQELFTATATDTTTTTQDTAAAATKQTPSDGSRRKKFLDAIKAPGKYREALMITLKPSSHYYKARGLWLQSQHGDYSAEAVKKHRVNNNKDIAEWKTLAGSIQQDAFGDLLRLYNEIIDVCDIFPR